MVKNHYWDQSIFYRLIYRFNPWLFYLHCRIRLIDQMVIHFEFARWWEVVCIVCTFDFFKAFVYIRFCNISTNNEKHISSVRNAKDETIVFSCPWSCLYLHCKLRDQWRVFSHSYSHQQIDDDKIFRTISLVFFYSSGILMLLYGFSHNKFGGFSLVS